MQKYYFDTSIWLDLFEERNEPNLPKTQYAKSLMDKIIKEKCKIIYSDLNSIELKNAGYDRYIRKDLLYKFRYLLIFIRATESQVRRAKDISSKRKIPKGDALHALIARDNRAILVTLDKHFQKLKDITLSKRPQDII